MPYELEFDFVVRRVDEPCCMEGEAVGDLSTATGVWRLFEEGSVTAVVYEWDVTTSKRWMNVIVSSSHVRSSSTTTTWSCAGAERGSPGASGTRLLAAG